MPKQLQQTDLNLTTCDEIHFLPGGRLELVVGARRFVLGADLVRSIQQTPAWN